MTEDDPFDVIIDEIGTFRPDALICAEDIRIVLSADGHEVPSDHQIYLALRTRCDVAPAKTADGANLYVRRW